MHSILKFMTLLFMSSTAFATEYTYTLSVCAIFNNEADYLKEWIDFHRLVGVEYFYLYNNNSTDQYKEVLSPYIENRIVELHDWPSPPEEDWVPAQIASYNHCLKLSEGVTKWLAIIDCDEFIVPVIDDSLLPLLEDYESFGGIKIFWQNFGTSHLSCLPPSQSMIESLTLKYPWNSERNRTGKCIIRPERVKRCNIHDHVFKEGYFAVTERKTEPIKSPIFIDKIRINHYWTRAEDYFYNQKLPRMARHNGKPVPQEKIDQILFESNQVEDTLILRFAQSINSRND